MYKYICIHIMYILAYLSKATCLTRPRLSYVFFAMSRIAMMCCVSRRC